MPAPDPKRVEELFQQAVDLPTDRRAEWLSAECGDDGLLRAAVDKLVGIHDRGLTASMRTPVFAPELAGPTDGETALPQRIGRYEIIRKVGEGGMGIVYEARQANPHRTVALKVIRSPVLGVLPASILTRFEHEAEILGQLQHPGIAQIYEAGSAEVVGPTPGVDAAPVVPFFAMEFVRGRPLHEYVAAHRPSTRDRLELVAKVCDAVHYAHQKGVIHRDLKPANILVSDEATEPRSHEGNAGPANPPSVASWLRGSVAASAQPKVLDFGVARTTDADVRTATLRTDVGQLIGTIPYMGPEQVAGDSRLLDARADVYALGVILYELLSGRLPHDVRHRPIPEAVRIIREEEPTRLSSIDASFRGDIETIVSKALEKDKARRYASAAELAADIRRFLHDEPIIARPTSTFYQMRKFARRNRGVVIATGIIFVLLVAGITATTWLFLRAEHHRQVAVHTATAEQRQAYAARIAAAQAALNGHDLIMARRALDAAPPELRGWEWRFLDWLAERGGRVMAEPHARAHAGVVSRASPFTALALQAGGIAVWDLEAGKTRCVIELPGVEIQALALTPDGSAVAAQLGLDEAPVVLWDAADGRERWRRAGIGAFWPDGFTADGARFWLVASDSTAWQLDARTGALISRIRLPRPSQGGCAVSPDGTRLLAAVDRYTLVCLDTASGQALWERHGLSGGFSADGRSAWWSDRNAAGLLDAETGAEQTKLDGIGGPIEHVALSPDGTIWATRERGGALVLREVRSGAVVAISGTRGPGGEALYADGGRRLVAVGPQALQVWDGQLCAAPFAVRSSGAPVGFSRDGSKALVHEWGVVRLLDLDRGAFVWNRPLTRSESRLLALSPDEQRVAVCTQSGEAFVLDAGTGQVVAGPWKTGSAPVAVAWAEAGLLLANDDGSLRLVDAVRGSTLQEFRESGAAITCLAMAPDGQTAALGRRDGAFSLINLSTRQVEALVPSPGVVKCAAFSADGKLLAAGVAGGGVVVWESETIRLRLSTDGRHASALAFHPEGSRLAACLSGDLIELWDTNHGDRLLTLRGSGEALASIAFTADGRTLLSGTKAEVVRFDTGPPACGLAERERFRRARALFDAAPPTVPLEHSLRAVQEDASLSTEQRQDATNQMIARGDNPNYLNSEAWGHVQFAGRPLETYREGLRLIEAACAVWPDDWGFLNTLGVAQYRCGEHEQALATLRRSTARREATGRSPHPADLAFIALACNRLGRVAEARASLELCRERMLDPEHSTDRESAVFLQEAESAIESGP